MNEVDRKGGTMNKMTKDLSAWWLLILLLVASLPANSDSLVDAVQRRDNETVRSLLEQGTDVNGSHEDGATGLMWAAYWGDVETAELLIRSGAEVNAENEYGATPLWLACSNGHADMVQRLLDAGADPNTAVWSGETALMTAVRRSADAVKLLLLHGADVNAQESRGGQTSLMWSIVEGDMDISRLLVEHGADVHAHSKGGFTPLLFAVQQNDLESVLSLLESGADVNDGSPDTNPLLLASAKGYGELLSVLVENGANPNAIDFRGYTALHYAAQDRDMAEATKILLAYGADPNVRIWKEASEMERAPIVGAAESSFLRSPTRVINVGTKGGPTPIGATPFWLATLVGNVPAMRVLLEGGADWRLTNTEGIFFEGGSGRRAEHIANQTPFMLAAGAGRIGDNWSDYTPVQETRALEALKILLGLGADVNETDEYGFTALHGAAYIGAHSIISFLVENAANIDAVDNFGQTPLSIAERIFTKGLGGSLDASPHKYRRETADLLLKLGATSLEASGIEVFDHLKLDEVIVGEDTENDRATEP